MNIVLVAARANRTKSSYQMERIEMIRVEEKKTSNRLNYSI